MSNRLYGWRMKLKICGCVEVDIRDAVMILLKLNETARITIDTPVVATDEFEVKNVVKQGTVSCG